VELIRTNTGEVVDTFPVSQAGMSRVVAKEMKQITLKVKGPSYLVAEPREVRIGVQSSLKSCPELLPFTLKGSNVSVPVKVRTVDGELASGPPGL